MGGLAAADGPFPGDDGQRSASSFAPEDDSDLDQHFAWLVRELDAGRVQPPPERTLEGPAVSVSLGDACDVDPELLEAMCGSGGLGGEALSAVFGQDQAADALRPGPVLAALTAQAVSGLDSLTDSELIGALQAGRRLANLADYQQTVVIAEFARRRAAEFESAKARGVPVGCRAGEFPGEELAMELVDTGAYTSARIDAALELTSRLPRTLAAMANGTVDLSRACTIASRTGAMDDAEAAYADEVLAEAAPGLRPDQLARKAAALEMKLAPEAVRARKELARQLGQRVEVRREDSGNASLSGRELGTADVIAAKSHIDAIAVKLRESGCIEGTLDRLRALALVDLTQGRDPLDRIKPAQAPEPSGPLPEPAAGSASAPGSSDVAGESGQSSGRGPARIGDPAPLPALINLLVPAGTLLGWGAAPGQASGWGLLDAEETTALVRAASRHPRTRWCFTLTAPDGTAIAHACATGRHPWKPPAPPGPPGPRTTRKPGDTPAPGQSARLADFLRRMNVTFEPIARDTCDHRHAEDRYVPSRNLKHLLRARAQTCTAPACNAQAQHCDIDHTVPYPDGPTCECNINPKCRRHHRVKQAPGWNATQPAPDTSTWTTPSGRTHTTRATTYDL
jgi:Domain of unknown function (DUF222)